jgi:hypothetical protein
MAIHCASRPQKRLARLLLLAHFGKEGMLQPIIVFETCRRILSMSVCRSRPEVMGGRSNGAFDPTRTSGAQLPSLVGQFQCNAV